MGLGIALFTILMLLYICSHTAKICGSQIPVDLCIALSFLWQIAISNDGPASAFGSMGPNFCYSSLNICLICKQ